jgi:hypothetical protein
MAPSPGPFWQEVKAQAIAGTVVVVTGSILAGIVYLVHTVPSQLNQVLLNQQMFRGRLETVERKVDDQNGRIIRLEARP